MGLYRPDEQPTTGSGEPFDGGYTIRGARLVPGVDGDWDEGRQEYAHHLTYPSGWEYCVVRADGKAWGWEREADLLRAGYFPPEPNREVIEAAAAGSDAAPVG